MQKTVRDYLKNIKKDTKREDCLSLAKIMEEESGYTTRLKGRIVAFGEPFLIGFLPRAQDISIYLVGDPSTVEKELEALGKHKRSKCCLYINKLADINEKVLRKVIKKSVSVAKKAAKMANK